MKRFPWPGCSLVLLVLLAAAPALLRAEVLVETGQLQLRFADNGDLLEARSCLPGCTQGDAHRQTYGGSVPVLSFTSFATEAFEFERREAEAHTELRFEDPANNSYRRWSIPLEGWRLELEVAGSQRLDVASGDALQPPEAYGFGVWLEQLRYVRMGAGDVAVSGLDEALEPQATAGWSGFRNRFWATMLFTEPGLYTRFASGQVTLQPAMVVDLPAVQAQQLSLYLGPVEPAALQSADPALHGVMYASLWFWLRWICMGLFWLFAAIHSLLPHWALAIVVLSVAVYVLMRPLSAIADRLQSSVHRSQALLAPQLRDIQSRYKGEEQSKRVLALYKEHDVHPLYSLKSLAGVAVVIPVFIGAFDMLAENIWLAGESFWWIGDLARPDALADLPFTVPFFGHHLNLLPFIMTALSVAASALHRHEAMDAIERRKQLRQLVLMALAFLALFYTFPAGMVLYWTTNNLIAVVKYGWRHWRSAATGEVT